jgi:hypothetical protein
MVAVVVYVGLIKKNVIVNIDVSLGGNEHD